MKKRNLTGIWLCAAVLLICGGCGVSRTDKARRELLAYLENRYPDDNFVWDFDEQRGTKQFDDFGFNMVVRCENMPDAYIHVSRWRDNEGHEIYADNYMAYYLHDDAEACMQEIAEGIFGECKVDMTFAKDVLVRSSVTIHSTAEDYLKSKPECTVVVCLPPDGLTMDAAAEKLRVFTDTLTENAFYKVEGAVYIMTSADVYADCDSFEGYVRNYAEPVGRFEIAEHT